MATTVYIVDGQDGHERRTGGPETPELIDLVRPRVSFLLPSSAVAVDAGKGLLTGSGLTTAQRQTLFEKRVALLDATIAQLDMWHGLAQLIRRVLPWWIGFGAVVVILLLPLIAADRVAGIEFAGILIALAVFLASPVAILLLERPLESIDKYGLGSSKTGTAEEDDRTEGGDESAGSTAEGNPTTQPSGGTVGSETPAAPAGATRTENSATQSVPSRRRTRP